jgi:spore germination cell wall hydrolase CwlJ-like protein
MVRSFTLRLRAWRNRIALRWLFLDKGHLALVAMLAAPILVLGSIVHLAYTDQQRARLAAAEQRAMDLRCLAENVYFEARGESVQGQYAVAEVTLNRVRSPDFPDTVCEVVHDTRWDRLRRRLTAHFSWTRLAVKQDAPQGPAWDQAMVVATAVYDRTHTPVVPTALFYHSTDVRPYWADSKQVVAKIGRHIFYR